MIEDVIRSLFFFYDRKSNLRKRILNNRYLDRLLFIYIYNSINHIFKTNIFEIISDIRILGRIS